MSDQLLHQLADPLYQFVPGLQSRIHPHYDLEKRIIPAMILQQL